MSDKCRFIAIIMLTATTGMMISSCGSDDDATNEEPHNANIYKCTGVIDGHEYVDLGLSVSWATENIGANSVTDSGNDYFWADPTGNITFSEANSRKVPNPPINGSSLDIATVLWGKSWTLPTLQQVDELSSKCSIVRYKENGKNGLRITGPNGNCIFLPEVKTRYSFDTKAPYKESVSVGYDYMFSGETFIYKNGKTDIDCGFCLYEGSGAYSIRGGNGDWCTFAVRAVTKKGATGSISSGTEGGSTGGSGSAGGSTTTYEKPDIGMMDYTCYTTSITVRYRIYNQDKAKVTSAKGYYGTSSASRSVSASVAGSLITIRISGLKKGTTYYVKCSATGKGGTTTSETTKLITNY